MAHMQVKTGLVPVLTGGTIFDLTQAKAAADADVGLKLKAKNASE